MSSLESAAGPGVGTGAEAFMAGSVDGFFFVNDGSSKISLVESVSAQTPRLRRHGTNKDSFIRA